MRVERDVSHLKNSIPPLLSILLDVSSKTVPLQYTIVRYPFADDFRHSTPLKERSCQVALCTADQLSGDVLVC
jgi:hypothetical protein